MADRHELFIFLMSQSLPLSRDQMREEDWLDDLDYAAERAEVFTETALRSVLSRMAGAPSSGVCRSCTDNIEPERLRANPQARLCSCCAEEEEHHRKRTHRCGPRGN